MNPLLTPLGSNSVEIVFLDGATEGIVDRSSCGGYAVLEFSKDESSWHSYAGCDPLSPAWQFTEVPGGDIQLSVNITGYLRLTTTLGVNPGQNKYFLQLTPRPTGELSISGRVTAKETGVALPGVTVRLSSSSFDGEPLSEATDEDGNFEFPRLVEAEYFLSIESSSHLSWNQNLSLKKDLTVPIALIAEGQGTVILTFIDSLTKQPVPLRSLQGSVDISFGDGTSFWHDSKVLNPQSQGASVTFSNVPRGQINVNMNFAGYFSGHKFFTTSTDNHSERVVVLAYPSPRDRTLSGTIRDKETGLPIPNVSVGANFCVSSGCAYFDARSDAQGAYQIRNMFPGAFDISVMSESHLYWNSSVSLLTSSALLDPVLTPRGTGVLAISFVDRQGNPVNLPDEGVYFNAFFEDDFSSWGSSGSEDAQLTISGNMLTLAGVPDGFLAIHGEIPGHYSIHGRAAVEAGIGNETMQLVSYPTPRDKAISGQITNRSSGGGLDGAFVSATNCAADGCAHFSTVTNPDGTYEMTNLFPGIYHVYVDKAGYRNSWNNLRVTTSTSPVPALNFSLKENSTEDSVGEEAVLARVADEAGGRIQGIRVSVSSLSGSNIYREVMTDPSGEALFEDLPPGIYGIQTDRGGQTLGRPNFLEIGKRGADGWGTITAVRGSSSSESPAIALVKLRKVDFESGVQNVQGTYQDLRTKSGIASAKVVLYGEHGWFEATTGATGSWTWPLIPHGSYEIWTDSVVNGVVYNPVFRTVSIPSSTLVRLETQSVIPGNGTLDVVLRDRANHKPVEGVRVSIFHASSSYNVEPRETNDRGIASFSSLPAGAYYIIPEMKSHIFGDQVVIGGSNLEGDGFQGGYALVGQSGNTRFTMRGDAVDLGGVLNLTVKDINGEPVEGAYAYVQLSDLAWSEGFGRTGPEGKLTLEEVPIERAFQIFVSLFNDQGGSDVLPYSETVLIPRGSPPMDLEAVLSPGGSLSGTVATPPGRSSSAGISVSAHRSDNLNWVGQAFVGSDGRFEVRNIPEDAEVVLFFSDTASKIHTPAGFGFKGGGEPLEPDADKASKWTLKTEQEIVVNPTSLEPGGTVSGKISVRVRNDVLDLPAGRWVDVELIQKISGDKWQSLRNLVWDHRENNSEWNLRGLPVGDYKVRFSESQFVGTERAYLTQEVEFSVPESLEPQALEVIMSMDPPSGRPSEQLIGSQNGGQENGVNVPLTVQRGTAVTVKLPEEMMGEWVSVWGEVTPVANDSLRSAGDTRSSARVTDLADGWVQVGKGGVVKVVVPGNFPIGTHKIGVQDANQGVVGWSAAGVLEVPRKSVFRNLSRSNQGFAFSIVNYDRRWGYDVAVVDAGEGVSVTRSVSGKSLVIAVTGLNEGETAWVSVVSKLGELEVHETYEDAALGKFSKEGAPTISGSGVVPVGSTLVANPDSLGWEPATPAPLFAYQWQRRSSDSEWIVIARATRPVYRTGSSDAGKEVRVRVVASSGAFQSEVFTQGVAVRGAQRAPTVSATRLSGTVGGLGLLVQGAGARSGSYVFQVTGPCSVGPPDGTPFATITPVAPGRCLVTAAAEEDSIYAQSPLSRALALTFTGEFSEDGRGLPTIVVPAAPRPGVALRVDPQQSLWSPANARFAYQWERSSDSGLTWTAIPRATRPTYRVSATDAGRDLRVRVVATSGFYQSTVYTELVLVGP